MSFELSLERVACLFKCVDLKPSLARSVDFWDCTAQLLVEHIYRNEDFVE